VHAVRFLEERGVPVPGGIATAAFKTAVAQGLVDPTKLPAVLQALRVRNWLAYHSRSVGVEDIRLAIVALHEACCGQDEARAANARPQESQREQLVREIERSGEEALIELLKAGAAVAAIGVLLKGADSIDDGLEKLTYFIIALVLLVGLVAGIAGAVRGQ
jgi:hypothetical protein